MADITRNAAQVAVIYEESAEIYDVTMHEAVTKGQAGCYNTNGKAQIADANVVGKQSFRGVFLKKKGAGEGNSLLKKGHVAGWNVDGMNVGAPIYLSDTAGEFADAASATKTVVVGSVAAIPFHGGIRKVIFIDANWRE